MFGPKFSIKRGARDEAEKPFWISFADLMTALMVLFLVVMGVALLAVTDTSSADEHEAQSKPSSMSLSRLPTGKKASRLIGIATS